MDKNTIWGLVLMAAIFFGFMYCNKPSQEQIQQQQSAATSTEQQAPALSGAYLLAPAQMSHLRQAVLSLGSDSAYTDQALNLRLTSAGVEGTVTVNNQPVSLAALTDSASTVDPAVRRQAVATVENLINRSSKYGPFAAALSGENTPVVLENDLVKITINTRGAMVAQAELKQHFSTRSGEKENVCLFKGSNDSYGFIFTTNDQRLDTREFNFRVAEQNDSTVLLQLPISTGATWGIRYTLSRDNYLLHTEIVQQGMALALPASTASLDFQWHQTMARNEKGRTFEERNSGIHYKYVGDSPDDLTATGDETESLNNRVKWVAFKNQYFSSIIIARDYFTTAEVSHSQIKDGDFVKDLNMKASLPYNLNDGTAATFDFYFGPNEYERLCELDDAIQSDEDLDLGRLIPLGWSLFRWINTLIIIPVFNFLASSGMNMGLVILLLTLFIKFIIFPFTYKSLKGQARMRLLRPEIDEINKKYPGQENMQKRQQETMALYSRAGASPFSGCVPMLFQMPVLVAMFSFLPSAIALRGESFLWAADLSAPDFIVELPFSIPFYGNGVALFCLMMTVVNVVYMRINMQNQPGGEGMPGMKWMMYLMPVMFLFFFNDYASGLSYYYFLSLLITIVQTWAFRRFINHDKVRAELLENLKNPKKPSGFMARLQEAQRQAEAAQRAAAKRKK